MGRLKSGRMGIAAWEQWQKTTNLSQQNIGSELMPSLVQVIHKVSYKLLLNANLRVAQNKMVANLEVHILANVS